MSFSIGRLEKNSAYLMADLVELIVSLKLDGRAEFQLDDIASIIEGQPDFDDRDINNLRDSLSGAWGQLEYRSARFNTDYPFRLVRNGLRLKTTFTAGARIYLLLLACSRLRSFDRELRNAWATTFAFLSREALRELMPASAAVKIFDANSEDRKSYFGTDLRKALKVLGRDLAAAMINEAECDLKDASGDAGIDLVAIAKWNDNATGIHAILGQCAAREKEWPEKRFEASPLGLRGLYSFLTDPVNAVFIPVLYREANGSWVAQTPASGCLLVDRLRILLLLNQRSTQTQIVRKPWFRKFELGFDTVRRSSMLPAVA